MSSRGNYARSVRNAPKSGPKWTPTTDPTYHERAQDFIKSSKAKGYSVKAEGEEIIATPPKKAKPTRKSIVQALRDRY